MRYLFDRVRCSSEKKRSRCPERRTGTQAVKPDVQLAAQPALLEGHTVASEEGRFFSARVCRRPKDIPACCAADDAARCTERSAMTNVASSGANSCCQMRRQELSRMRREMGKRTWREGGRRRINAALLAEVLHSCHGLLNSLITSAGVKSAY